jgi:hypothetical protein
MPPPVDAVTRGFRPTSCSMTRASMLLWSASHASVAAACEVSSPAAVWELLALAAATDVTDPRLDPLLTAPACGASTAAPTVAVACARQASRLCGHCSTTSMRASNSRTIAAQEPHAHVCNTLLIAGKGRHGASKDAYSVGVFVSLRAADTDTRWWLGHCGTQAAICRSGVEMRQKFSPNGRSHAH